MALPHCGSLPPEPVPCKRLLAGFLTIIRLSNLIPGMSEVSPDKPGGQWLTKAALGCAAYRVAGHNPSIFLVDNLPLCW
jgi:hypothetical protein